MNPLLIVVTGRPASGKTTLAHILAKEIKCPLLSRDEFKEGYINTTGLTHDKLPAAVAWDIYGIFFQAVDLLISKGISIIIEAAFQHTLWNPKLSYYSDKAAIRLIICETDPELAKARFTQRFSDDPGRDKFHGDRSTDLPGINGFPASSYTAPQINVPTLHVDTSINYNPGINKIVEFIKLKSHP